MNEKVKAAIVSLIRAVQAAVSEDDFRDEVRLAASIDKPGTRGGLSTAALTLAFGYGYFDWSKVMVYLDHEPIGEAEVEEAAVAYLEGRVPKMIDREGKR